MRGIVIRGPKLDDIRTEKLPETLPKIGANEALLEILAVSLQWRDLAVAKESKRKYIPCSDACARVIAVGAKVSRVRVGDRVCPIYCQGWISGEYLDPSLYRSTILGCPRCPGVLQERRVVSESGLVLVPPHLTDYEAATLPCAAVTAWRALVTEGNCQPGEVVLTQGLGGVSVFSLQLARALGAQVINICSSETRGMTAITLGANHVINYNQCKDWGRKAKEWAADSGGVHHVIEVGGAATVGESLEALRSTGNLAIVGIVTGSQTSLQLYRLVQGRVRLRGIIVGNRDDFEAMNEFISAHKIRPVVHHVYEMEQARDAFKALQEGKHVGKICIRVSKSCSDTQAKASKL